MNPICPINRIGIRHPVICSDGYMHEEKCIKEWIESGKIISPLTQVITIVEECNLTDKSLNKMAGVEIEEEYDRTNFLFTKENATDQFYIDLIENDKLKNDRELVMEAVEQDGSVLEYASYEIKNDRKIVKKAVKQDE